MITREEAMRAAKAVERERLHCMIHTTPRYPTVEQMAAAIEEAANEKPWEKAVKEWMLDGRELRASAEPLFELLYYCYTLLEPSTHSTPKFTTPNPGLIQSLRDVLKLESQS